MESPETAKRSRSYVILHPLKHKNARILRHQKRVSAAGATNTRDGVMRSAPLRQDTSHASSKGRL